jgi:hypothetical protein
VPAVGGRVERPPGADDLQVVEHVTRLRGERRDRLGGVEAAAAAQAQDHVAAGVPRRRRPGPGHVERGLTRHGEVGPGKAMLRQQRLEPRVVPAGRAAHDEHPPAQAGHDAANGSPRTGAEHDPPGRLELEAADHYQPASSG